MARPGILLLGKRPPPYMGPAVATEILMNSRLAAHYDLHLLDTNLHAALDTIDTWSLRRALRTLGLYARCAGILWRQRPALVWVPMSQTTLGFVKDSVFMLLGRLFGRPTLVQLRGSNVQHWLAAATAPTRAYVGFVLRRTQGVIVLGETLRYLFADYYPAARIFAVPNGADYDIPRTPPLPGDPVRVLYLANLMPSKGIEDFVAAVALLHARGVGGFRADVVGAWVDEATRAACRARVDAEALPITFHGPLTGADKLAALGRADVFVFVPRAPEGHPWVLVEALAAGLPVVATDQGAIRESVVDGVNGFVVASRSPDQIADRLGRLLASSSLRARQGAAGLAHYQRHFTEDRMVARLCDVFAAVRGAAVAPESVPA